MRPVSVYASEFRQLACDVQWDGQALCDHFRRGLRSEIKNLLLNFPEPTSLSQAITQAVSCDNRLFELRQEERATSRWKPSSRSLHRHCTMTSCRWKLIELAPRHSPRVNGGIAEPTDYVYIVVHPPISFVFAQSRIINDKYLQTIRQDGPNNGKTTVSNYSRSHVVGQFAFMLLT